MLPPTGELVWRQRRAPLGLLLEKFENAPLTSPETVTASSALGAGAEDEWFSPGSFAALDDAEALNRPAFERLAGGLRIGAGGTGGSSAVTHQVTVVEFRLPDEPSATSAAFAAPAWLLRAADARAGIGGGDRPAPAVAVAAEPWQVRDEDGQVLAAVDQPGAGAPARTGAAPRRPCRHGTRDRRHRGPQQHVTGAAADGDRDQLQGLAAGGDRRARHRHGGRRARGQVALTLSGSDAAGQSTGTRPGQLAFLLAGPGDVSGLEPAAISPRFPAPDSGDAETTKCPYVELADAALPWRYTPAATPTGGARRLRPWLILVVGTAEEVGIAAGPGHAGTGGAGGAPAGRLLPLGTCAGDPRGAAGGAAAVAPALPATTDLVAALVPGFAVTGGALADAWSPTATSPVTVPAYAHWGFRTGPGGDFRTLATRLRPAAPIRPPGGHRSATRAVQGAAQLGVRGRSPRSAAPAPTRRCHRPSPPTSPGCAPCRRPGWAARGGASPPRRPVGGGP